MLKGCPSFINEFSGASVFKIKRSHVCICFRGLFYLWYKTTNKALNEDKTSASLCFSQNHISASWRPPHLLFCFWSDCGETPVIPACLCLWLPVCLCLSVSEVATLTEDGGVDLNLTIDYNHSRELWTCEKFPSFVSVRAQPMENARILTAVRSSDAIPTSTNTAAVLQWHFQGSTAKPTASRSSLGLLAVVQAPWNGFHNDAWSTPQRPLRQELHRSTDHDYTKIFTYTWHVRPTTVLICGPFQHMSGLIHSRSF